MQGPSNTDPNANNTPLTASGAANTPAAATPATTTPGNTLATGAPPLITNGVDPRAAYLSTINPTDLSGNPPIIPGWNGPAIKRRWRMRSRVVSLATRL